MNVAARTKPLLSLAEATRKLAIAQSKYANCPEKSVDETRLYAELLEAEISYLRADIGRIKGQLETERRGSRDLRRTLNSTLESQRESLATTIEQAREALQRKRRPREAATIPLLDHAFGSADAQTPEA